MLADAAAIARWAGSRSAQGTLPKLIRQLVHATAESPSQIRFAADEGVQLPGWDGIVVAATVTPFVPAGVSGWELGTSADPRAKANDDYATRTASPGPEIDPGARHIRFRHTATVAAESGVGEREAIGRKVGRGSRVRRARFGVVARAGSSCALVVIEPRWNSP
jgi:hypothetical protein